MISIHFLNFPTIEGAECLWNKLLQWETTCERIERQKRNRSYLPPPTARRYTLKFGRYTDLQWPWWFWWKLPLLGLQASLILVSHYLEGLGGKPVSWGRPSLNSASPSLTTVCKHLVPCTKLLPSRILENRFSRSHPDNNSYKLLCLQWV